MGAAAPGRRAAQQLAGRAAGNVQIACEYQGKYRSDVLCVAVKLEKEYGRAGDMVIRVALMDAFIRRTTSLPPAAPNRTCRCAPTDVPHLTPDLLKRTSVDGGGELEAGLAGLAPPATLPTTSPSSSSCSPALLHPRAHLQGIVCMLLLAPLLVLVLMLGSCTGPGAGGSSRNRSRSRHTHPAGAVAIFQGHRGVADGVAIGADLRN